MRIGAGLLFLERQSAEGGAREIGIELLEGDLCHEEEAVAGHGETKQEKHRREQSEFDGGRPIL